MLKAFFLFLVAALVLAGCTAEGGPSAKSVLENSPTYAQFLKEHPNAEIRMVFLSEKEINPALSYYREICNKSLEEKDYYLIESDSDRETFFALIDYKENRLDCGIIKIKTTPKPTEIPSSEPNTLQKNTVVDQTKIKQDEPKCLDGTPAGECSKRETQIFCEPNLLKLTKASFCSEPIITPIISPNNPNDPKCSEGTFIGRCSKNKPFFCTPDQELIQIPNKCGCPEGQILDNQNCILIVSLLTITPAPTPIATPTPTITPLVTLSPIPTPSSTLTPQPSLSAEPTPIYSLILSEPEQMLPVQSDMPTEYASGNTNDLTTGNTGFLGGKNRGFSKIVTIYYSTAEVIFVDFNVYKFSDNENAKAFYNEKKNNITQMGGYTLLQISSPSECFSFKEDYGFEASFATSYCVKQNIFFETQITLSNSFRKAEDTLKTMQPIFENRIK